MSIVNNRVSAGGRTVENDPKSATSRRTLPLPDRLVSVLKAAKALRPLNGWPSAPHMAQASMWCRTCAASRMRRGC